MGAVSTLRARQLVADDVDAYIAHVGEIDAASGVDGAPHAHPYPRSELDLDDGARRRELDRWSTDIDVVGWRRAWGLFDVDDLVGHLYLAGGELSTEMHRTSLGMGIVATHHRRGGGSLLLSTAIAWVLARPGIAWIDLGVFSGNAPARALYARHGFTEIGTTTDRFRVDGASLDDVMMTLDVAERRRAGAVRV